MKIPRVRPEKALKAIFLNVKLYKQAFYSILPQLCVATHLYSSFSRLN